MPEYVPCVITGDDVDVLSLEDTWFNLDVVRDVAVRSYLGNLMLGAVHKPGGQLCVVDGDVVVDVFDPVEAQWKGA